MKDRYGNEHDESNGQFTSNGSTAAENKRADELTGNKPAIEDITDLLGEEYTGVKGQAAIEKLLQEKRGYVKSAFHHRGLGDIDLLWGNDKIGLKHIIKQRTEQGIDVDKFLKTITDTIENGEPRVSERGNIEILKDNQVAVIQLEFKGNKLTFVITAYKSRKASW